MRRVLVTGSAGFVGRHMVRELASRGYEVIGLDLEGSVGIPGWPGSANVLSYFEDARRVYDLVVHCAYHVGGRFGIDGTNMNFAKNLELDAAMFSWAVRTKQKRVLYFSSSSAYPVALQQYIAGHLLKEDDIDLSRFAQGLPDANYGWAKLTGERLAQDARKNGLPVTVVRPFSGYGEDQSFDYPFPSIVARAKAGDLSVWGPQGQCRDWIHISDVVKGALAVVESGTDEPVNLCTGIGTEMGELSKMVFDLSCDGKGSCDLPHSEAKPTYDESKPTGVFYRVGSPDRMLQYYEPKITLEEGIQRALKAS